VHGIVVCVVLERQDEYSRTVPQIANAKKLQGPSQSRRVGLSEV
jgi:hypothetical protein